jgi:hypothetical protein
MPWSETVEAELDLAICEYNAMIEINNRVSRITGEANSKGMERLARFDWEKMSSFSDGWVLPATNPETGLQTIITTCCNPACESRHIQEFRIHDGKVEFRTYGMEKSHDGIQNEDGDRAGQARARTAAA